MANSLGRSLAISQAALCLAGRLGVDEQSSIRGDWDLVVGGQPSEKNDRKVISTLPTE
jgi:hypothetical protein